jgi:hypothetical protein
VLFVGLIGPNPTTLTGGLMKKNCDSLHGLIGGMTTDYFEFFCKEFGTHMDSINFYGFDSIGVKLTAKCSSCNREYIFKIKTFPTLGPIEIVSPFNGFFKKYDLRKLNKHFKSLGKTPLKGKNKN